MHLELNSISLSGLVLATDIDKLKVITTSGDNIKVNISSFLRFTRPDYVECVVTLESGSESDAVRFKCSYTGEFSIYATEEITEERHTEISAICTAKIFPYLKELVADITRRLPLSSPIHLNPALGDEQALLRQMKVTAQSDNTTTPKAGKSTTTEKKKQ